MTVDDIYKLHKHSYVDDELTFDDTQSITGKRLQWLLANHRKKFSRSSCYFFNVQM